MWAAQIMKAVRKWAARIGPTPRGVLITKSLRSRRSSDSLREMSTGELFVHADALIGFICSTRFIFDKDV